MKNLMELFMKLLMPLMRERKFRKWLQMEMMQPLKLLLLSQGQELEQLQIQNDFKRQKFTLEIVYVEHFQVFLEQILIKD